MVNMTARITKHAIMTQQQFEGIIRHTLTLIGAVVLVFFSGAENLVGELTGSGVMLAGVIWSLAAKTDKPVIDKVRGLINHSIAIVTAFLIYFGAGEDALGTVEAVTAAIVNLLPFILSFIDKKK